LFRVNRLFLALLLTNFAFGEEFISEFEYGQMFYNNPRGVSCAKCHGKLGDGKFIGEFKDDEGKLHRFEGSDITKLDFKTFSRAIAKGGTIMPRYYLTKKEIKAIYEYIKIVNLPQDKQQEAIDRQESYEPLLFEDNNTQSSSKKTAKKEDNNSTNENKSKNVKITKNFDSKDIEVEQDSSAPIELNNSSLDEYKSDSDVDVQDSFNEEDTIYTKEVESVDDNDKNSIISTIFNSLEVEGDEQ
jgi:hypothetical protein